LPNFCQRRRQHGRTGGTVFREVLPGAGRVGFVAELSAREVPCANRHQFEHAETYDRDLTVGDDPAPRSMRGHFLDSSTQSMVDPKHAVRG
jgi:hypothetical protein